MLRQKDRETHTRGGMRVESLRSEATHSSLTTLFYPPNRAEAEGRGRPRETRKIGGCVVRQKDRETHTRGAM